MKVVLLHLHDVMRRAWNWRTPRWLVFAVHLAQTPMRNLRQKGIMNSEKIFEMIADRIVLSFQFAICGCSLSLTVATFGKDKLQQVYGGGSYGLSRLSNCAAQPLIGVLRMLCECTRRRTTGNYLLLYHGKGTGVKTNPLEAAEPETLPQICPKPLTLTL